MAGLPFYIIAVIGVKWLSASVYHTLLSGTYLASRPRFASVTFVSTNKHFVRNHPLHAYFPKSLVSYLFCGLFKELVLIKRSNPIIKPKL